MLVAAPVGVEVEVPVGSGAGVSLGAAVTPGVLVGSWAVTVAGRAEGCAGTGVCVGCVGTGCDVALAVAGKRAAPGD